MRDRILKWFWISPEDRAKPIRWQVLCLNFFLAVCLIAPICFFSFSQLRYAWNWGGIAPYGGFFLKGWRNTLWISSMALVLSTFIGLVVALARRSGLLILQALSRLYVEVIRGTPLLVQISFGFYVVADAFHFQNRLIVGVLTLSLFSGAFISEIIRSGIESVGFSQLESARAIGLTRSQTYRYVIFPQAIRLILPPLAGMLANLIKDSSLLAVIAIDEFTWSAQNVAGLTYSNFECYLLLAVGYLILTLPITLWTQWLEKRTQYET
jgi:polar amino acid transport system permease protein